MSAPKRRRFAARLARKALISAPGVYDLISAKLADRMGFDALYMTGYGVVASHLGLPDAGLATYSDMVGRVGQTPGGVTDNSARVIADRLGTQLGQQVIVENRPGASGNIGTQGVAQSAPDGHTLLLGFDGTMVINPHVFPKIPFDTLRDFAPVTKLGDAVLILVAHPSVPAKNLAEFIALAKKDGRRYPYGTSGSGRARSPRGCAAPARGSIPRRARWSCRPTPPFRRP